MDRLFTVINPAAGGGRCGERCEAALDRLREAGLELEVRRTTRAGEASELVRQAHAAGARRFLAVGGDGTGFEVVNGLFPREAGGEPVTLGLLPLGTGNSFLRDFGVTDTEGALGAILSGRERAIDVVRATHAGGELFYINLLSLGFSALVGDLTNRRFKRLGTAGYVAAVLSCVARLEHPVIPVRLDGGEVDARPCALLSFSNSRYTGGAMMMAPEADASDGALDVIRVGALGRGRLITTFPRIFQGTHVGRRDIEQTRAKRVEMVDGRGEQPVMVDGEILPLDLRGLEVLPGAMRVMA